MASFHFQTIKGIAYMFLVLNQTILLLGLPFSDLFYSSPKKTFVVILNIYNGDTFVIKF